MPKVHDAETAIQRVDTLVGTLFDQRFRIEERIAAGGFGAIYRATHVKSGHDIALKLLLPELARDLGVVARFRREGATMVALRNPHTIAAYELGQTELGQTADCTLFIVMELLHGTSLFERYREHGPFEWKRMVKIAREVCESLAEAHALGIVHRDLKPTNIHLERHGTDPDYVKVLDFGIAKILRGSDFDASDITNAGQMIGTLDYMSPEQMVGGAVNGQTDIYTLGIVMYEMIAGCTPFPEAMTAAVALSAMLKTKPHPLYMRAPVPQELDRIVMRCLERDLHKRWQNVTELSNALARLVGAPMFVDVRTVQVQVKQTEDDSTTVNQPPELLDDLGSGSTDAGFGTQTTLAESLHRSQFEAWTDDDEFVPTQKDRRRELEGPTVPAARPLPRQQTPVPQLVAAPFSVRRTPTVPPPRPPTPAPVAPGLPRQPTPRDMVGPGEPPRRPTGRDMHATPRQPTPRDIAAGDGRRSARDLAVQADGRRPTPRDMQSQPDVRGGRMPHDGARMPHDMNAPISQPGARPDTRGARMPTPRDLVASELDNRRGPSSLGVNPSPFPRPATPLPLQPPNPSQPYIPYSGHLRGQSPADMGVPRSADMGAPQRRRFDMGKLVAREAAIRRLVWIIVLIVAASVGVALASWL